MKHILNKKIKYLVTFICLFLLMVFALLIPSFKQTAFAYENSNEYLKEYSFMENSWSLKNVLQIEKLRKYIANNKSDKSLAFGDKNLIIAVIDSGIDKAHPYFKDSLWVNPNEIDDEKDNDGNGIVDDLNGAGFFDYKKNNKNQDGASDKRTGGNYYHGTHVAGIVHSIVPNAKIMAIRTSDTNYRQVSSQSASVEKAIYYAVDNGAKIINLSMGTAGGGFLSQNIIDYASSRDVIIVASAGNDGKDTIYYPASYQNVISVMSSDKTGNRSSFSNYYKDFDVFAPGNDILSTVNHSEIALNNGFDTKSGTSMSAPYVTGVAGLIWSYYGLDNTASFITDLITNEKCLSSITYDLGTKKQLLDYNAVYKMLDSKYINSSVKINHDNLYKNEYKFEYYSDFNKFEFKIQNFSKDYTVLWELSDKTGEKIYQTSRSKDFYFKPIDELNYILKLTITNKDNISITDNIIINIEEPSKEEISNHTKIKQFKTPNKKINIRLENYNILNNKYEIEWFVDGNSYGKTKSANFNYEFKNPNEKAKIEAFIDDKNVGTFYIAYNPKAQSLLGWHIALIVIGCIAFVVLALLLDKKVRKKHTNIDK